MTILLVLRFFGLLVLVVALSVSLALSLMWALCQHSDYLTHSGSCRAFDFTPRVYVAFCADW